MTADAASAACCCGGGEQGIDCPEWIACAPQSLLFSWAHSDAVVRRYPAGGQYLDSSSFTASGILSLGLDGVYRGTIACDLLQTWQLETTAGGIAFEEDPVCAGNPWGCPNLDCCATHLVATDQLVYDPFTISVTIRCIPGVAGFPSSIEMRFDGGGASVGWTRTFTTVFCPDPSVPNPDVTTGTVSAISAFQSLTNLPEVISLPRECLPTAFFDQYNADETIVETLPQLSDLVCFRRTILPPYFELVGSCLVNQSGEDVPRNCGDAVFTRRLVRVVTLG